jgi:hypothetical protein
MNRKDLIFAAIAIFVIGLFIFLSRISTPPKPMTARAEHAGFTRETTNQTCLDCHALTSGVAPMPQNHPKKGRGEDQRTPCTECHTLPKAEVARFGSANNRKEASWPSQQQK